MIILTLKQFKTSILNKEFGNLYLLVGEEKFLINQYLKLVKENALTGSFNEFNLFEFENENADGARTGSTVRIDDIEQAVGQLPQMSDRVLVIVKYSKHLEAQSREIAALLENIPKETILIFVEENIKKISKVFLATIEKNGAVVEFNKQSKADLAKWVNIRLGESGKKIDEKAAVWLVENTNRDMYLLANTIDKLICATGDEVISFEVVRQHVAVSSEYKIYDMSDKLIAGNAEEVYKLLNDFKQNKEEPVVIITLLFGQLHAILMIKELREEGHPNPSDFLPANMKWLVGKLFGVASRIDKEKLVSTMELCAKYDEEIKNGLIDGYPALEIIIANFLAHG